MLRWKFCCIICSITLILSFFKCWTAHGSWQVISLCLPVGRLFHFLFKFLSILSSNAAMVTSVSRFGLSRPPKKFGLFFKLVGLKFFLNLLSVGLFFKVYGSLYSKIQNFSFLKTEFGIFQFQAPGNPDANLTQNE